jgi:hypothetical protein
MFAAKCTPARLTSSASTGAQKDRVVSTPAVHVAQRPKRSLILASAKVRLYFGRSLHRSHSLEFVIRLSSMQRRYPNEIRFTRAVFPTPGCPRNSYKVSFRKGIPILSSSGYFILWEGNEEALVRCQLIGLAVHIRFQVITTLINDESFAVYYRAPRLLTWSCLTAAQPSWPLSVPRSWSLAPNPRSLLTEMAHGCSQSRATQAIPQPMRYFTSTSTLLYFTLIYFTSLYSTLLYFYFTLLLTDFCLTATVLLL